MTMLDKAVVAFMIGGAQARMGSPGPTASNGSSREVQNFDQR